MSQSSDAPPDPPRLRDPASSASERVKSVLSHARQDVATRSELAVLDGRLASVFGDAPRRGARVALRIGGASVAIVAVAALALAAGGGFAWMRGMATRVERPAPGAAEAVSSPSRVVPRNRTAKPSPVTSTASPPVEVAPGTPPRREGPGASESDLLGRAQAALASDPARALSLTAMAKRDYPRGVLVQEREVIAIEALSRLGRTAAAKARAGAFIAAFPGSAYRSKVENLVSK